MKSRVPTPFRPRKATRSRARARALGRPCVVGDPGMRVRSLCGNREICRPAVACGGRRSASGRPERPKPMMHGRQKSDSCIVPRKPANKAPVGRCGAGGGKAGGHGQEVSAKHVADTEPRITLYQAPAPLRQGSTAAVQPAARLPVRHRPEAGAGCGNSARPDLCGGRGATRVPTATPVSPGYGHVRGTQWRKV